MRIALLLPLLASLVSACRASDDERSRTADSAGAAGAPSGLAGAPSTPTLGGACSAMARISRGTLRVAIGRDRATNFPAPRQNLGMWHGCRLVGNGVVKADSSASTPDVLLQPALVGEGWTSDPEFSAHGTDATEFGVRRASALCVVSISYPNQATAVTPGTPPGSPVGQAKPYRIQIRCTDRVPVHG
jgi:hypothetical protein